MVVQCTWKPVDDRDVSDAVTWTSAEDSASNDVEEEVQAENCLLLVAPYDVSSDYVATPSCQLLISCHATEQIQYISILSEARVLEIYGHHGEYLKTVRNELIEEVEDMAVFKGDIQLDRPLNVCSIKFACLRSKAEMWLYGVKVGTSKTPNRQGSPHQIQFAELEQRLKEMSISDKAEAFKQLMEAHNINPSGLGSKELFSLINLFKSSNASQILPNVQNINNVQNGGNLINSISANIKNEQSNGEPHTSDSPAQENPSGEEANAKNNNNVAVLCCSETQTEDPPPPNMEDILKAHIDQKFEELDKQLWEKIQKRFEETEAKLLCKLDEIESFVKPQGV